MTVKTTFTPDTPAMPPEPVSSDVKGPTRSKRTFQSTLFDVRFGPQRDRLPPASVVRSTKHDTWPTKRHKVVGETESNAVAAPEQHHRGPFHQVSRAAFCRAYRIDDLPDADIYYQPSFVAPAIAEEWRRELDQLPEWYRPKLKVYGKVITQSREIAAYATAPGLTLNYSGHPVEMHYPFPPLLNHIASLISMDDCIGSEVRFNHCMLNRYDDGSVYIGRHSDNLENKVIVTLSLGADRSWIMQRKAPRSKKEPMNETIIKKRWTLANGSLLVMQGTTQKYYTHEIPKELKIKGPRISITFRQLVYDK